jgi:type III secretory pathway component EscU
MAFEYQISWTMLQIQLKTISKIQNLKLWQVYPYSVWWKQTYMARKFAKQLQIWSLFMKNHTIFAYFASWWFTGDQPNISLVSILICNLFIYINYYCIFLFQRHFADSNFSKRLKMHKTVLSRHYKNAKNESADIVSNNCTIQEKVIKHLSISIFILWKFNLNNQPASRFARWM